MRLAVLTVLLLLPSWLFAQTGKSVLMEWKFTEGEKFWVDTQTKIEQTERIGTANAANIVHVRTITSYLVKKVTEAKYVELEAKIESARYQSNQTSDSEKMAALFSRLQGAAFKITLTPEMTVGKLEGYQEWLSQLSALFPTTEIDRIRALVPEADLRNAINEGFGFLPGKEVSLNNQWKKRSELNLAPAGNLVYQLTYAYKGNEKGKEKITIDCKEQGKFTATPGLTTPGSQSEFILDNRTGTIYFNQKAGKLEQAEHNYQTRGQILMPATTPGSQPTSFLVLNRINVKQYLTSKPPAK
jgi:hypothetical protein